MPSKLQGIYDQLNIDRSLTKRRYRKKTDYNSVKDNVRLEEDCAFMIDILEMPTAKFGFKYCLVCCDIASDEFDIEKMKNKDPSTVLKAFRTMLTRPHLNKPKYYMISDGATDFKGVFQKYLYDESINHKVALKNRHTQLANIDSLIAMLVRIFFGYMNEKEKVSGKYYKNWTDIINITREQLNTVRKKQLPANIKTDHSQALVQTTKDVQKVKNDKKGNKIVTVEKEFVKPKFKVGDNVYVKLEAPQSILGKAQPTLNFRNGDVTVDRIRRTIEDIVYMNGRGSVHRYLVSGYKNVSFSDDQLLTRL